MKKPSSHQYWLLKTEPEVYSFTQLLKDGKTNWDHVRNYQARNNLRLAKKGDLALIYHSGDVKSVVGIAKVVKEAYPDIDPEGGDWAQIDIQPVRPLDHLVSLATLKSDRSLQTLPLIKNSRLSVMPISEPHFEAILNLAEGGPT